MYSWFRRNLCFDPKYRLFSVEFDVKSEISGENYNRIRACCVSTAPKTQEPKTQKSKLFILNAIKMY